jgi:hypothetical protein
MLWLHMIASSLELLGLQQTATTFAKRENIKFCLHASYELIELISSLRDELDGPISFKK